MSNFLNLLKFPFSKKQDMKPKRKEKKKKKYKEDDGEESSILLEENDRLIIKDDYLDKNTHKVLKIKTSFISIVYGTLGVFSILSMFLLYFYKQFYHIGTKNSELLMFFNLHQNSSLAFNLILTIFSIFGMLIVCCIYKILNSLILDVQLKISLFYGVLAHVASFIYGYLPIFSYTPIYDDLLKKAFNISIYQSVFLVHICSTIFYGILIVNVLSKIFRIGVMETNKQMAHSYKKKYIIMILLVFLSIFYLVALLLKMNTKNNISSPFIQDFFIDSLIFLPYILYFTSISFYLSFSDIISSNNICLSIESDIEHSNSSHKNIF